MKIDSFNIHLIKQSSKDMENGHQWSWKVLEIAHKKVLESRGKPLSVFCTHPVSLNKPKCTCLANLSI